MIGERTGTAFRETERGNSHMPKKSKNLLDHANDLATDIADKIGPQLESAVETAREKAGPVIADARDKAGPAVHDARDKITSDVLPVIAAALAAASEATEDVRGETKKRGKAAVAALRGDIEAPVKKKHRFRNFLIVLGLGGAAAFVAKKLSDRPSSTTWESTPVPTPAPAPAAPAGAHRAEGADADDQGGASPDVAAADAASQPHEATTPDNPAETIDVKHN
jgi:vacuolar-type H+-ATPase subunit H